MRKRILIAIAALAAVFVISVVGASVLDLSGSDRAPGEGKTEAACASNLMVKHPVSNSGHDSNTISHVDVLGDMTQCEGQTLRVEIDVRETEHAYAFVKIGSNVNKVTLHLNANTGDFTDAAPTVVDGELVSNGNLVAPLKATDFGLVSVLIASSWE